MLITSFGTESDPKNFGGEGSWLAERKDLLNYKFIFTFQPDGHGEPTCATTWFFILVSAIVWLMLTFLNWNVHSWCFYLFIYSFCCWVDLKCMWWWCLADIFPQFILVHYWKAKDVKRCEQKNIQNKAVQTKLNLYINKYIKKKHYKTLRIF